MINVQRLQKKKINFLKVVKLELILFGAAVNAEELSCFGRQLLFNFQSTT